MSAKAQAWFDNQACAALRKFTFGINCSGFNGSLVMGSNFEILRCCKIANFS